MKIWNIEVLSRLQVAILLSLLLVSDVNANMITVSIPPIAGIIGPILGEGDQLNILLKPGVSPHGFQLKPSHLRTIQQSDLVISVGTPVDAWVKKPIELMQKNTLSLIDLQGVEKLTLRQGGLWEKVILHHGYDNVQKQVSVIPQVARLDGHLWMSVQNAIALVRATSSKLQALNPKQSTQIKARTKQWLAKIKQVDQQVMEALQAVKFEPYLVLHDAFQYFENHYQLAGVGSIRLNPELPPSLQRIHHLRTRIKQGKITCLFKEPQFSEKRVMSVISGLNINISNLDPMGTSYLKAAPYVEFDIFLQTTANQFINCLSIPK